MRFSIGLVFRNNQMLIAHSLPKIIRGYRYVITKQLHIFVRRPSADHSKVYTSDDSDGADLKKVVMAELKMDIAPDLVRLSLEVKDGKGEPVLIDSCKKLLAQGVIESSKVLVDVSTVTLVSMSTTESTALENVNRLHSALRVATLEPIPTSRSSLIRLPDGVFWPQLGAEPLFVRDFYQGCYEGPLSFLDPDCKSKFRKFIIRGNS